MIVAAVAGLFAAAAQAQSSVTLYGLVDAGMTFATNIRHTDGEAFDAAKHVWGVRSGNVSGSRFGFRGVEDLGNGLKATFVLENGFSVAKGSLDSGLMFGRQAYLGVSSDEWGELTVGRQYDTNHDFLGPFTLGGAGYGGAISGAPFDNNNLLGTVRADNSVKFVSSDLSGMKFGGIYSFSNKLNFGRNRSYGGAASYNFDGLNVAAGYYHRVIDVDPETSAPISYGRSRIYGAGADYDFGSIQVSGLFTRSNYDRTMIVHPKNVPGIGRTDFDYGNLTNVQANARYSLTPAWNLAGQYIYTKTKFAGQDMGDDIFAPKFHTVTLQTAYALSKRTDVYLLGTYQRSHAASGGTIINEAGPSPRKRTSALSAGVRHRF